jgi:putative phosphoribosyl transferase
MATLFEDRTEAGRELARALDAYTDQPDVVVLALPRGGVPIGFVVAQELDVPLDIFLVRKLGVPGHPELAMGAIAAGGVRLLNDSLVWSNKIPEAVIDAITFKEERELARRERLYRGGRPALDLRGRTVILVDDGMAMGASMAAAVTALRRHQPARIVVAVPVASKDAYEQLRTRADEVICLAQPEPFFAVGQWYEDFRQVTDREVRDLLEQAALRQLASAVK